MKRIAFLALLAVPAGCAAGPVMELAPSGDIRTLDGKRVPASSLWSSRKSLVVFMTTW